MVELTASGDADQVEARLHEALDAHGLQLFARIDHAGLKRLHHPLVGQLELSYVGMTLAADADLVLFAFTAEAGSKSDEALNLLASWTATESKPIDAAISDRNE